MVCALPAAPSIGRSGLDRQRRTAVYILVDRISDHDGKPLRNEYQPLVVVVRFLSG